MKSLMTPFQFVLVAFIVASFPVPLTAHETDTESLREVVIPRSEYCDDYKGLVRWAVSATRSMTEEVREYAADALDRLGTKATICLLDLIIVEDEAQVRADAARLLGSYPGEAPDKTVKALRSALADHDELVRAEAAASLGRLGAASNPAIPELLGLLRNSDGIDVGAAVRALGELAVPIDLIVPALVDALEGGDIRNDEYDISYDAYLALCRLGPRAASATPSLVAFVGDERRRFAERDSSGLQPDGFFSSEVLGEFDLATSSIDILGAIGPRASDAIPELRRQLSHPSHFVRLRAAAAIWQISGHSQPVLDTSLEVLRHPRVDEECFRLALSNLEWLGRASIQVLPELIKLQTVIKRSDRKGALRNCFQVIELQESQ